MFKKSKKINKVLAEGEQTGHAHVADVGEVIEVNGQKVFATDKPAKISHEEHKTVSVPPGKYETKKVREFDHFVEETREVAD